MGSEKYKMIFFDFDGVIADSFSAAFLVSKMIHPFLQEKDYIRRFDGNINEVWDGDRAKKEYRADIDFVMEYTPLLLKSPLFQGVKELLETIQKNSPLIIVSSSTSDMIKEYLVLHEIDHYFLDIMGNDTHKSKIKKIEMALVKYSIVPEDCIFVTDTLGDIKEAHHVGIKTVAVTWGYQPKTILEQGNPFAIVNTMKELLEVFI
jgi:phosphoglycolate phosphatase